MMKYVKRYIRGGIKRFHFDLHFKILLIERWEGMIKEDKNYAKAFRHFVAKNGYEIGGDLSDSKYKELIKLQYLKYERHLKKLNCIGM